MWFFGRTLRRIHEDNGLNAQRVLLRQPALPHYRLPIFQRLAAQPGLCIRVVYGRSEDITNVTPQGLDAAEIPYDIRTLPVLGEAYTDPAFREQVKSFRPDAVIVPWNARQRDLASHLRWLRRRNIRSVLWGHGYSKQEKLWRRWLRNRVGREGDALLLYSHAAADRLIAEGFAPERVFVAPNALDQTENQQVRAYWNEHPDELSALAEKFGVYGRRVILFVSRLDPANHLHLLIEALPLILKSVPDAVAVIVGGGDTERHRLEMLAREYGVFDDVRFTGPIYDAREIGGLMSLSEVFCYPRNIGLSILHAFAFALPVVTSDDFSCHNPEIEALRPDKNGLLFQDQEAGDLAKQIKSIMKTPALRKHLSEAAFETVYRYYTAHSMVERIAATVYPPAVCSDQ